MDAPKRDNDFGGCILLAMVVFCGVMLVVTIFRGLSNTLEKLDNIENRLDTLEKKVNN